MSIENDVETKVCPDCAETIRADARVCKHCSYRFTDNPNRAAAKFAAVGFAALLVIGGWQWWTVQQREQQAENHVDTFIECVQSGRSNC